VYAQYFGEPNSHKSHELLHTHYTEKSAGVRTVILRVLFWAGGDGIRFFCGVLEGLCCQQNKRNTCVALLENKSCQADAAICIT